MRCVEFALKKECVTPASTVNDGILKLLVVFFPDGYAMLMRPNKAKAETAVRGQDVGWYLFVSLAFLFFVRL